MKMKRSHFDCLVIVVEACSSMFLIYSVLILTFMNILIIRYVKCIDCCFLSLDIVKKLASLASFNVFRTILFRKGFCGY
ncbi:hypothetical protein C0J52_28252 [Blattella germanica]|nr:hypothetical protein C0J52_28252 [Blattella germanica]